MNTGIGAIITVLVIGCLLGILACLGFGIVFHRPRSNGYELVNKMAGPDEEASKELENLKTLALMFACTDNVYNIPLSIRPRLGRLDISFFACIIINRLSFFHAI